MSFRINTNVSSIQGQKNLARVSRETTESYAKLSTGERITKAADDAAGLAISEKIKAEIRSSKQANRNANDGVSLVQVAEGGLSETSTLLTRMRELSIQAASDTLADSDRAKASLEYEQIKDELERISKVTEFNGRKLLDGSGPTLSFQVGVGADSMDDHINYDSGQLSSGVQSLGVSNLGIRTKEQAQNGLSAIDSAINKVSTHRSTLGSIQNRLMSSAKNLEVYHENMSAANNRIRDVDYAEQSAIHARNGIISDAATAVQAQANTSGSVALKLL